MAVSEREKKEGGESAVGSIARRNMPGPHVGVTERRSPAATDSGAFASAKKERKHLS